LQAEMDHKETQHYKVWKTAVENMMAEPRSHSKLTRVY
jgi:quinol monooxygenase YgiN